MKVGVDYDELLRTYQDSLVTVLRGFTAGADFLDLWVPDDDHHKSILGLVESAGSAGLDSISIRIGAEIVKTLNFAELEEMIGQFGAVHTVADGDAVLLEILYGALAIHPAYQARLRDALISPKHAGCLAPEAGLEMIEASRDGVTMMALVNAKTHTVRRAAYSGATSDVQRGLLEVLCEIVIDRPIQDCAEHSVISLEHKLRDPLWPHAVSGILSPENADPAFQLPMRLVRELGRAYCRAAGYVFEQNFYEPPASSTWRKLSQEAKYASVKAVLTEMLASLHLSPADVALMSVGRDDRVWLDFTGALPGQVKGHFLMRIEAALKARVEERLHVYTADRKDLNKIRRLAGAAGTEAKPEPRDGSAQ